MVKIKKSMGILFTVLSVFFLLGFSACSTETDENDSEKKTEDPKDESPVSPKDESPVSGSFSSDKYWWGTWQRMSDGKLFVIDETSVKEYSAADDANPSVYSISSYSTADSLTLSDKTYIFSKTSDRVMEANNIPYFRQGGTNLEFSLRLVGFDSTLADISLSRAVSGRAGITAKITSPAHPSYVENTESDSDGNIVGHALLSDDPLTVTVIKPSGSTLVIPGLKVETNGSNLGTVPVSDDNQYILKVTGSVSDADKTDGYLYGNNYKKYPMTLTIANVSDVDCISSYFEITAENPSLLSVTATGNDSKLQKGAAIEGTIPSLAKGAVKTISLEVECNSISEAFVDTGLNIKISNSSGGAWVDYVPLRFYKGLVPISFAAISDGDNSVAALNGFIIYPDNNTKFFAVDQSATGKTLYLPSFGASMAYTLVFCGATTSQILSESTEMFYTVALGSASPKTVKLPNNSDEHKEFVNFAEGNESEETAAPVKNDFEAYLQSKEKDFYTLTFSDDFIINASSVPKDYWTSSASKVEALKDETLASNSYGVYFGTLANSDSWVVHKFYAANSGNYTIEWGDKGNQITESSNGETYKYDGSARLWVSASTSSNFSTSLFSSALTSSKTISVSSSGYIYIKLNSWSSVDGGTYALRVKDSSGTAQKIYLSSSSGYAGYTWTVGKLASADDSKIYYFYADSENDYTLRWSDAGNGFGHSADIKISASTDASKFSQTDSEILFHEKDNGFTESQTFSVSKTGYVFFKVTPQSSIAKYDGTFALLLTDKETYIEKLAEYTEEKFTVASGDAITNKNAWKWGCVYPDGYDIFSFPVEAGKIYSVVWDDKEDGSSSYTGDLLMSAYASYSDGTLSEAYWENIDSGYSVIRTFIPKSSGKAYIKTMPKTNDSYGTYRLALAYGPDVSLTSTISDEASYNCNFYGYDISKNSDATWLEAEVLSESDDVIFYYKPEKDKVYKLFVNDKYGKGSYTANTKVYYSTSAVFDDTVSSGYPTYFSPTSFYYAEPEVSYLHVKAYDSNSLGTFAITMLDGENKPVTLTKLTATTGSAIEGDWLTGELTSKDDRIVYRYKAKKNTFFKMFFDDKKDGSGQYTADIEVTVDASNEDKVNSNALDSGYTSGAGYATFSEDIIIYFYVNVKGSAEGKASSDDIGTYRITIVEGNDISPDFIAVSPNSSITISEAADISVSSNISEANRIFTADAGYDSYKWYLDGVLQTSAASNIFTLDISALKAGTYEIEVEAKKGSQYFSSTIFMAVE